MRPLRSHGEGGGNGEGGDRRAINAVDRLSWRAFIPTCQGNPRLSRRGTPMPQTSSNRDEESAPQPLDAEDVALWDAARKAIYDRTRSMSPPEATAVCLERSAESHDRIATMYEEIAGRTSSPDECRENASRHRVWAREDRRRAAQLRLAAERQSAIDRFELPE